LRDVFFAQLPAQAARGADQDAEPRAPSIVRRKDNEWTQAEEMAIPVDRIGFMETVGSDSRMARFVANARSQPPLIPGGQLNGQSPANGQNPDGSTRTPPPDAPKN
jgi:hypothetical protein